MRPTRSRRNATTPNNPPDDNPNNPSLTNPHVNLELQPHEIPVPDDSADELVCDLLACVD